MLTLAHRIGEKRGDPFLFPVLMFLAIGGMVVAMRLRGLAASLSLTGVCGVLVLVSAGMLATLLSRCAIGDSTGRSSPREG
jgi:hypothetical protein